MALTTNLVSYWKLGDVNDSVGSNNLTNNNTTTFTSGLIGNAATFVKASSQSLSITNAAQSGLNITGALTLNAWVKINGNPATQDAVFDKGNRLSFADEQYRLQVDTTGVLRGYIGDGASEWVPISTGTVTNNIWRMVTLVFIPSTSVKLYIDGSEDGSITASVPATLNTTTHSFYLGANDNVGDSAMFMGGQIDEAGIWSRALSTSEITSLYNGGAGFQYPFTPTSGWVFAMV